MFPRASGSLAAKGRPSDSSVRRVQGASGAAAPGGPVARHKEGLRPRPVLAELVLLVERLAPKAQRAEPGRLVPEWRRTRPELPFPETVPPVERLAAKPQRAHPRRLGCRHGSRGERRIRAEPVLLVERLAARFERLPPLLVAAASLTAAPSRSGRRSQKLRGSSLSCEPSSWPPFAGEPLRAARWVQSPMGLSRSAHFR